MKKCKSQLSDEHITTDKFYFHVTVHRNKFFYNKTN